MLYQNILMGITPYHAAVGRLSGFGEHRHADIEFNYCLRGSFDVIVNRRNYTIHEGEILLINPMSAHAFPKSDDFDREVLTVVLGVSFLKNYFSCFSSEKSDMRIISRNALFEYSEQLYSTLDETASLCRDKTRNNDFLISGNLYKICSYLIDFLKPTKPIDSVENKQMIKVANIECALEMIYFDYTNPITVDDAARATGYGKSNFCKIFKSITGDTFHNILNRQRIESSCTLLCETDMSVSEIAAAVGFGEAKTFCRVFKSVTSLTPGAYRKNPIPFAYLIKQ